MPKLPTLDAIGVRDPRASYSPPSYPTDSPVAQASMKAGAELAAVGLKGIDRAVSLYNEEKAKTNTLNMAETQSGWNSDQITLDRKYTVGAEGADADYGTWSQRHQRELEAARQQRAAGIQDPDKRALFLATTADDITKNNVRVATRSQDLYRNEQRTKFTQTIDADIGNETAADLSIDDRERFRAQRLAKIDAGIKNGIITPQEGLTLRADSDGRASRLLFQSLPPDQRITAFGSSRPAAQSAGMPSFAVVGDSHAQAIRDAGKFEGDTANGRNPGAILEAIEGKDWRGKNVILSTGVANDPGQIAIVGQQVERLKAKGAIDVMVVGVGPKYGDADAKLAAIAKEKGVSFTPLEAGGAGYQKDGVHLASYGGLTRAIVGAGGAPSAPEPTATPAAAAGPAQVLGSGGFPASLISTESGGRWTAQNNVTGAGGAKGHFGRLQFGQARLAEAAAAGAIPAGTTPQQFMNSPELQQAAERWHFGDIDRKIAEFGFDKMVGQSIGGVPITIDGMRAVAHLGGTEGMRKFVESGGQYNPADANGTSLADYFRRHAGNTAGSGGGLPVPTGPYARYLERLSPEDRVTLRKQALTDLKVAAGERAEAYETAIINYSAGRGALPPIETVMNDPMLDAPRRNAVMRMHDAASGGVTRPAADAAEGYERNILDWSTGRGEPPSRDQIANDGRLKPAQRNALIARFDSAESSIQGRNERANTQALLAEERERTRAASARNEAYERDLIEASRGAQPLIPRAVIENDPVISKSQQNTLLTRYDKAAENVNALTGALTRLQTGQLDGAGFSKDTHKDVDAIFSARLDQPSVLFAPDDRGIAARSYATELARRTGFVPTVATDMIRGGFASPDPARVEAAAQLASQIMAANPNAFATAPGREEIQQNARAFEHYVDTMAMPAREAAAKLAQQNDPEWKRKSRKSQEELTAFEKDMRDKDAINDVRSHMATFSFGPVAIGRPDLSFTQAGVGQLEADYVLSARLKYETHGDAELAKKQARMELFGDPKTGARGVYGVTKFAGRPVLMKYAPEAAPGHPPMPDGGHDYIAEQAVEHIKAVTGKDPKEGSIRLEYAGRDTAEAFRRGLRVPYRMFFEDETGKLQEAPPNSRQGWAPDPAKAREKFSAQAVADQDRAAVNAAYGLVPPGTSPDEARLRVAEQDAARRASEDAQAAARRPMVNAEIERSRELAATARQNQGPTEVDPADLARVRAEATASQETERQARTAAEVERSREVARASRRNRKPIDEP